MTGSQYRRVGASPGHRSVVGDASLRLYIGIRIQASGLVFTVFTDTVPVSNQELYKMG